MDNIEHLDFEPGEDDEPLGPDADGPPKGANTPATQESVTPLGWKPTAAQPVPVVRCTQIKKDGVRCGRWSLRGYTKCQKHAGPGALMPDGNVNKYREAVIEAAKLRLLNDADDALDVLEELRQRGTAEAIRLKAAESVLDRAGIRGGFELDVNVEVSESPADEIRKRLAGLKEGAEEVRKMREAHQVQPEDADVVDAEFYEDDPAQPTLFDEEDEQ